MSRKSRMMNVVELRFTSIPGQTEPGVYLLLADGSQVIAHQTENEIVVSRRKPGPVDKPSSLQLPPPLLSVERLPPLPEGDMDAVEYKFKTY